LYIRRLNKMNGALQSLSALPQPDSLLFRSPVNILSYHPDQGFCKLTVGWVVEEIEDADLGGPAHKR
jgi:hypothetical protein